MAEQIKLGVNLYENAVTAEKGDYVGRPIVTGTLRNEEIADRIVAKRTEYRKKTIVNILGMADEERCTSRWR